MANSDLPDPGHLFGAYFHQDWDLDGPDDAAVIAVFIADNPDRELRAGLAQRLVELSTQHDDATLDRIVFTEYGCCYFPSGAGLSTREWLRRIATLLTSDSAT